MDDTAASSFEARNGARLLAEVEESDVEQVRGNFAIFSPFFSLSRFIFRCDNEGFERQARE
jgi:hypothetical protein